jgi:hypothetical protein
MNETTPSPLNNVITIDVQSLSQIWVGLAAPNLAEVEVAKRNQVVGATQGLLPPASS